MSELELRQFFGFDEKDLSANRAWRLSDKQLQKIRESSKKVKLYGAGIGIVLILIGALILAGIYPQLSQEGANRMEAIMGMITVSVLFGIFTLVSFSLAFQKIDLTIAQVEGKVNFVKVEKTQSTKSASGSTHTRTIEVYEMRIGNVNFHNVPEMLLNLIEEGDTYAVYFLKVSTHILSLEFISKGK